MSSGQGLCRMWRRGRGPRVCDPQRASKLPAALDFCRTLEPSTLLRVTDPRSVPATSVTAAPGDGRTPGLIRLGDAVKAAGICADDDGDGLARASCCYLAARQELPEGGRVEVVFIFQLIVLPALGFPGERNVISVDSVDVGDSDRRQDDNCESLGSAEARGSVIGYLDTQH